jgi:hypothetical protein
MNNINFVHFQWGTHHDHGNKHYALSNSVYNKFYLLEQDYKSLKMTQFLVMPFCPLASVDLTAFDNYTPGLIDNSVCFSWGINDQIGFQPAVTGYAGAYRKKIHDQLFEYKTSITEHDIELQKKLLLVNKILSSTDRFIKYQCNLYIDQYHNNMLKQFFEIIAPADKQMQELIDIDNQQMQNLEIELKQCYHDVILFLSKIDYSHPYNNVVDNISMSIQKYSQSHNMDYHRLVQTLLTNLINL